MNGIYIIYAWLVAMGLLAIHVYKPEIKAFWEKVKTFLDGDDIDKDMQNY